MKLNHLYQHKYCIDVAFKPLKLVEEGQTYITYQGSWYNVTTNKYIDDDEISISKKDLFDWNEVVTE